MSTAATSATMVTRPSPADKEALMQLVKPFQEEYKEMKVRFYAQHKIIPVRFDDAMNMMFSEYEWERNFMIYMWTLLKIYSEESLSSPRTDLKPDPDPSSEDEFVFDFESDFPDRLTFMGGPVPIHFGSRYVSYRRTTSPNRYCRKDCQYKWTYNSLRFAILAIRAMDGQPILPPAAHRIAQDPVFLEGRDVVTCGELLPSVFTGQKRTEGIAGESNQFGGPALDAHTLIFCYIAATERCNPYGDLTLRNVERRYLALHVDQLFGQRLAYEDFWIALARTCCVGPGCWDMGVGWAEEKLENDEGRSIVYYSREKANKISQIAGQFMDERNAILSVPRKTLDSGHEIPLDVSWENIMSPDATQTTSHQGPVHESRGLQPTTRRRGNRPGSHVATPKSHLPPGVTDDLQGHIMSKDDNQLKMVLRVPKPDKKKVLPPMSSALPHSTSQPPPGIEVDTIADTPTDTQRSFQAAIFQELWPLLRPSLDRADVFRLARVNSEVGTVATKALYRETTLCISSDPKDLDIFTSGFPNTSRPGLSKAEAFSYLKAVYLERPNLAAARGLLKIPFVQLDKLVIGYQYLADIILQSHAMTVKPPALIYMRYDNQTTPFNFAEAQLVHHLVSHASLVDISVHTSTMRGSDSERPLGYFKNIIKRLGIPNERVIEWSRGHDIIDWTIYLASPPFVPREDSNASGGDSDGGSETDSESDPPVDYSWWIMPDLGFKLSLDNIPPIDTLKLRIVSASTNFRGLSAKNLVIVLAIEALYMEEPDLTAPECLTSITVATLAILHHVLQSRLVNTSSVSVLLPNPPNSAMITHIRALYPDMVVGSATTNSTVNRFLRIASKSQIEIVCDLTKASYIITVTNILLDQHASTPEEVADFQRITFGYQQEGPWRHSKVIPEMDQMDTESSTQKG